MSGIFGMAIDLDETADISVAPTLGNFLGPGCGEHDSTTRGGPTPDPDDDERGGVGGSDRARTDGDEGDGVELFWSYVTDTDSVYRIIDDGDLGDEGLRKSVSRLCASLFAAWIAKSPSGDELIRCCACRLLLTIEEQSRLPLSLDDLKVATQSASGRTPEVVRRACDEYLINMASANEMARHWAFKVVALAEHAQRYGVAGEESPEQIACMSKIRSIGELVSDALQYLMFHTKIHRKVRSASSNLLVPVGYSTPIILDKDVAKKQTTFQNVLLFVLQRARAFGYRKRGDGIFGQKFTDDGTQMHCWTRQGSVRDFINSVVNKETAFEQWRNLTNPRDNGEALAKHLIDVEHPELPTLVSNNALFAFQDGLYLRNVDVFLRFADKDRWPQVMESVRASRVAMDASHVGNYDVPSASDAAVSFIDDTFKAWYDDETPEDDPLVVLKTPNIDKVFRDQHIQTESLRAIYAQLGRLLYDIGELDDLQVLLYFLGKAGTGKGLIIRLMCLLFPSDLVAIISNNIEAMFGLAQVANKRLAVCPEAKSDTKMPLAEFQSAISGESCSCPQKFKSPLIVEKWTTPFLFAGNEMMFEGKDEYGALKRRFVVVEFTYKVQPDQSLFRRMSKELGPFLRKINLCYLREIARIGTRSIWDDGVLPEQLRAFSANMRTRVDFVAAFLGSNELSIDIPNLRIVYMPLSEFKDMYMSWRRQNGHDREPWRVDKVKASLLEAGLLVSPRETRIYNGRTVTCEFILGAQPMPDDCDAVM